MSEGAHSTVYEALTALEDYLRAQSFSRHPDPHVARIVLRNGEQYQGDVRRADMDSITLTDLPPHGATKRILATDITYLAVALPARGRWWLVARATLGLGDVVVITARLLRSWMTEELLMTLIVLVGVAGLVLWDWHNKPGSNLLPWVVTFSEQASNEIPLRGA